MPLLYDQRLYSKKESFNVSKTYIFSIIIKKIPSQSRIFNQIIGLYNDLVNYLQLTCSIVPYVILTAP